MRGCSPTTRPVRQLEGNRALGIAIWIGVAILTIALLVLMRTRWGQAQPLSKCVVLSVFAHVLLFLFAYGTHLLEVPRRWVVMKPSNCPLSPPIGHRGG